MVEARRLWEERARGRRAETREKHLEDVAGSLVDRQPALRSLLPELRSVLLSMAPGYCYEKGGKEGLLLFPGEGCETWEGYNQFEIGFIGTLSKSRRVEEKRGQVVVE